MHDIFNICNERNTIYDDGRTLKHKYEVSNNMPYTNIKMKIGAHSEFFYAAHGS